MKMMTRICAMVAALAIMTCSFAMADGVVDTIMNVGTTQAFSDEAVSADDLNTILRAGMAAASAINQQPWYFVAVTSKDVMNEIGSAGGGFTPPAGASRPEGASAPEGAAGNAPEGAPAGAPSGMPASAGSAKAGLGDSPAAVIIFMNEKTASPNANFDCGLAAQNMYLAAASLGYGVKIVSSPTMSLNGANHDAICEKLGVDPSYTAVAVLLIGKQDTAVDAAAGATTRSDFSEKASIVE